MLCDEMESIRRRMMLAAPKGSGIPLLKTARGKPWQKTNGVQRFLELKKELELPADRVMCA